MYKCGCGAPGKIRHDDVKLFIASCLKAKFTNVEKRFENQSGKTKIADIFVENRKTFYDITVVGANNHSVSHSSNFSIMTQNKKYQDFIKEGQISELQPLVFSVFGGIERNSFSHLKSLGYGWRTIQILNAIILRGSLR
ncbi:hypothetical protein GEMRC1_010304 [Eukaryota sp. GEM-RC1]